MRKHKMVKEPKTPKPPKASKPLYEGDHDDDCFMCCQGGDLLCCDYCEKAYHLECHLPPLTEIPAGNWKCQECAALEYTRKMKCGECKACLRDDCGKCVNCLDKPKFGGPGTQKQACVKRKCPFLRFAPPAKATPQLPKEKRKAIKSQFVQGGSSTKTKDKKKRKRESISEQKTIDEKPVASEKSKEPGDDPGRVPFRPLKRPKVTEPSEAIGMCQAVNPKVGEPREASGNNMPAKKQKAAPAKKQRDVSSDIKKIIRGKALDNDPIGNKIRLIIVKAIKHPTNAQTQSKACEMLSVMAITSEIVSQIILLGGLTMVSQAMIIHSQQSYVQAKACALLAELSLANPSAFSLAIIDEGFLQLVLSTMQRNGSDSKVLRAGCRFFRAISCDGVNHQSIDEINVVGAVIDAISRNPDKCDVLIEAIYFLQNMSSNRANISQMVELLASKGTISIIFDAMTCAPAEDSQYPEAAFGLFVNLVSDKSAKQHIGKMAPSIPALLKVLQSGTSNEACKCCLDCLRLLGEEKDFIPKIVQFGGIKTILDVLKTTVDVPLADAGVNLLVELMRKNEDNVQQIMNDGGFEMVTSFMRKHSSLSGIQASCCAALRYLPVSAEQVHETSRLILATMKSHHQMVQFEACHALLQYCCNFPSIAKSIHLDGPFPITPDKKSSKRNLGTPSERSVEQSPGPDHDPSQSAAMENAAMINDDDSASDIDAFIRNKPLKNDPIGNKIRLIIVKALKNPGDSKIQDKACETLRRAFASNVNNVSKILLLGGLKMISLAMKGHPQKSIVQAEASALLAELTWVDPFCVAKIVNEGCLQQVLSAMKCHRSNLKVQQMGCGFFRAMSYEPVNHPYIDSVSGVGSVIDSMKQNPKKYNVLKEGLYFLQNMLCNPCILPDTIRLFRTKDIIPMIIDRLSENPNAEFLCAACGVIANLSIDENSREYIGSCDKAVPTLLSVLGSGIDMDASKCALNALKLLGTGNDANKSQIVRHDGIKRVLDFLTPPNEVLLVDSGLGLLDELTKGDHDNSQVLYDAGGFDFLSTEMANHASSPHLQARAFCVLRNLPADITKAIHALNLTATAMKNHPQDSMVQYEGCHTLLGYCCRYPDIVGMLKVDEVRSILRQSHFRLSYAP
ncbi:hypothetical protein ACHAWF_014255 [Thalassiosira exigua]